MYGFLNFLRPGIVARSFPLALLLRPLTPLHLCRPMTKQTHSGDGDDDDRLAFDRRSVGRRRQKDKNIAPRRRRLLPRSSALDA